jgi:hypothetical protein
MTTTIRIRGREYDVETCESPQDKRRYRLRGKRGASFYTMRNVHRPHMMFVISEAPRSNGLERVWLSDENGTLRVVSS